MELFFGLLIELLGEFIVQFGFEAIFEVGLQFFSKAGRRRPSSPWAAVVGYGLLGGVCGGLSLWALPHFLIKSPAGRVISLIVTPLLAAGAMSLIGAWRRKRGEELIRLDRFIYGYVFAFIMAAIRFAFGHAG